MCSCRLERELSFPRGVRPGPVMSDRHFLVKSVAALGTESSGPLNAHLHLGSVLLYLAAALWARNLLLRAMQVSNFHNRAVLYKCSQVSG